MTRKHTPVKTSQETQRIKTQDSRVMKSQKTQDSRRVNKQTFNTHESSRLNKLSQDSKVSSNNTKIVMSQIIHQQSHKTHHQSKSHHQQSRVKSQDSRLKSQDSRVKTQDSRRSHMSVPSLPFSFFTVLIFSDSVNVINCEVLLQCFCTAAHTFRFTLQ